MPKRAERPKQSKEYTFSVDYRHFQYVEIEAINLFFSTFLQNFQLRYKVPAELHRWLVAYSTNPDENLQVELLMYSPILLSMDEVQESLDMSLFSTGLDQKLPFTIRPGVFRSSSKQ
jgi:hypothetical protein